MDKPKPGFKGKKKGGSGLSLDRMANSRSKSFDKQALIAKKQELKLRQLKKYRKLQKKLQAEGGLQGLQVKDNVEELDILEGRIAPQNNQDRRASSSQGTSTSGQQSSKAAPTEERQPQWQGESMRDRVQGAKPSSGMELKAKYTKLTQGGDSRDDLTRQQQGASGQIQDGRAAKRSRPDASPATRDHDDDEGRGTAEQRLQHDDEHGGKQQRHGGGKGFKQKQHHVSSLERLASKVAERKAEEQRVREEAMRLRAEKQAKIDAAQKARRHEKHNYFRKTQSGQPLMKVRLDKILSKLQGGS